VLATNTGIRILLKNIRHEYFNWPKVLKSSNIWIFPKYYSNSMCNVTCSAKALLSEFSTYSFLSNTVTLLLISLLDSLASLILSLDLLALLILSLICKMSDSSLSLPLMSKLSLPVLLLAPSSL